MKLNTFENHFSYNILIVTHTHTHTHMIISLQWHYGNVIYEIPPFKMWKTQFHMWVEYFQMRLAFIYMWSRRFNKWLNENDHMLNKLYIFTQELHTWSYVIVYFHMWIIDEIYNTIFHMQLAILTGITTFFYVTMKWCHMWTAHFLMWLAVFMYDWKCLHNKFTFSFVNDIHSYRVCLVSHVD